MYGRQDVQGGQCMATRIKLTREELIQQLLDLAEELGRTPKYMEFRYDPRTASYYVIRREFGNWNNFLEAAGFAPLVGGPEVHEMLIEQAQALAKKLGKAPTIAEFDQYAEGVTAKQAIKRFGTWSRFLIQAGLKSSADAKDHRDKNPVTDEQILDCIRHLAEALGRKPYQREFIEKYAPLVSRRLIRTRFGCWNKAIDSAFPPGSSQRMLYHEASPEELIEQVKGLAQELGRTPRFLEFDACPYTAHAALAYSRFGSWNNLIRAAGLEVTH